MLAEDARHVHGEALNASAVPRRSGQGLWKVSPQVAGKPGPRLTELLGYQDSNLDQRVGVQARRDQPDVQGVGAGRPLVISAFGLVEEGWARRASGSHHARWWLVASRRASSAASRPFAR